MLTKPGVLLRVESGCVLLAAIVLYAGMLHGSWWIFAALFFVPDLSLLGYVAPRHLSMAAALYNAAHCYLLPLILGACSWWKGEHLGEVASAIWIAHIAVDRLLGFGLKYPQAFKPTHLQTAGTFRP